jgi:hypothetical protein
MLPELKLSPSPMYLEDPPILADSWDLAEKRLEDILIDFKVRRTEERRIEMEGM